MSKYGVGLRDNLDEYFIPNITNIILGYYICSDDFCTKCHKHKGLVINIETKKYNKKYVSKIQGLCV